jgi:hypothetical protein
MSDAIGEGDSDRWGGGNVAPDPSFPYRAFSLTCVPATSGASTSSPGAAIQTPGTR